MQWVLVLLFAQLLAAAAVLLWLSRALPLRSSSGPAVQRAAWTGSATAPRWSRLVKRLAHVANLQAIWAAVGYHLQGYPKSLRDKCVQA